jgi:glycerol-3-phosphate acyltransferase PlsX
MRIAVDAMGGDHAPREIVAGALAAARELTDLQRLFLFGPPDVLEGELRACGGPVPANLEIRAASEVVSMDDDPLAAVRRKKDSSLVRAIEMVKAKEADAIFSAGNTGALVAATILKLRTLPGVERCAITTVMPTPYNPCVLLDAGANVDCTARMLCQFAWMGHVYAKHVLGVPKPRVGLLNIGTEEGKGDEKTRQAYDLLRRAPLLDFVGNVESGDLFGGKVDVVACDGFVGNMVLKTCESVARTMQTWMRQEFTRNPLRLAGAALLRNAFADIKKRADPATYGGAPLLGASGVSVKGHGSSRALAVKNAISVAMQSIRNNVNEHILEGIDQFVSVAA